jgi:hypothetical protein
MNRHDRKAWKTARTLDDLGELVVRWLNGEVKQTPAHLGGPDRETIPLIPALTVINRGGFITDNSQLADEDEEGAYSTCVSGFATDATLARLRKAAAGTPLIVSACRARVHECEKSSFWWRCPWGNAADFWAERCPAVSGEIYACWYVTVEDPEPGRNGLLWDSLVSAFADSLSDRSVIGQWAS